jgi:hypothetical protein
MPESLPTLSVAIIDDPDGYADAFDWGEPGDLFFEAREAGWGNEILRAYVLGRRQGGETAS